jgi:nitric oxide reductase subunit B
MSHIHEKHAIIRGFLLGALLCLLFAAGTGTLGVIFYNKSTASTVLGLSFQQLQPLHTFFAVCWIYMAGVATIYHFLFSRLTSPSEGFLRRARWGLCLWITAGVITVCLIALKQFTGREYLPFHPLASVLTIAGWICLAINFGSVVWRDFSTAFVWMWAVSLGLFLCTFVEAHLYLVPFISHRPLMDIAIQWKSYGALVGSFNLIVYGASLYVASQVSGCDKYARSRLAFLMFFIGILNSFTNYGHHTYHLPQSHFVKWFSFSVSMLEILIWLKIGWDLWGARRQWAIRDAHQTNRRFFVFATFWTFIQLWVAILISVPPLNSLIHGTHVVTAHAMGSMIGIDSMILWGCGFFLLAHLNPSLTNTRTWRAAGHFGIVFNALFTIFWLSLLTKGIVFGWTRFTGYSSQLFVRLESWFPVLFLGSGILIVLCMVAMLLPWMMELFPRPRQSSQQKLSFTLRSEG